MKLVNWKSLLVLSLPLLGGLFACSDLALEKPETTMNGWEDPEVSSESKKASSSSQSLSSEAESDISSNSQPLSSDVESNLSSDAQSLSSEAESISSVAQNKISSSVRASVSSAGSSSTGSVIASSSSVVLTNVGSLWKRSNIIGQVNVPCVNLFKAGTSPLDYNNDGVSNEFDCDGWWFGYTDETSAGSSFSPSSAGGLALYSGLDGSEIPGGNLTSNGFYVDLVAAAGADDDAKFAGIGFKFDQYATTDISVYDGYCVTYSLTGTSPMLLELGWDDANLYDVWTAELTPSTVVRTVALKWDLTVTDASQLVSGDFSKVGYHDSGIGQQAIATAVNSAKSLKLKLMNKTASPISATFTLIKLGKLADCQ